MAENNSFENCCRICEINSENVRSIHEEIHNGKGAVDMLEYCLQQPIDTSEYFPSNICDQCQSKLVECYEFLLLYKKSEEHFLLLYHNQNVMTNNIIKIEALEVPTSSDVSEILVESEQVNVGGVNILKSEFVSREKTADEQIASDETLLITKPSNQVTFECSICGNTYLDESTMLRHKKRHTSRVHDCEYCKESFEKRFDLKRHIKKRHKNEFKTYECNQCSEKYMIEAMLKTHMMRHNPTKIRKNGQERKFKCDICFKNFTKSTTLRFHKLSHTGEMPFICEICDRGFTNNGTKSYHMLTHQRDMNFSKYEENGTISYECFYCKKDFDQLKDLCKHIKVHPVPRPFECPFCKIVSKSERWMLLHKRKHTKLIHNCEYCEQSFETLPNLKVHIRLYHDVEELKTYACDHCPESFPLKILLNSHLELHDPTQQHLCPECGKLFRKPSLLKVHLLAHGTDKPFACTRCPGKFKTKGQLKTHLIVHSEERNCPCDQCGKRFGTPRALKVHKMTHAGIQPFQCETCLKRFATNYKLTRHVRTHTGEKPYKCEHCDRAFTQLGDMKKHRRIHVGQFPYECNECNQSFRLETELRKHSYTHFENSEK